VIAARLKQAGLVAAVCAFVVLTNLGGPVLWDRDEPRNAGCAREMLARGDWVVPTFNGELRTHKPVLLYWAIMLAYQLLGVSELAARLPSAMAAIGTAVCTWRMGHRLFGPSAGVWAGVALATSLMFVVAGRAATPDALLILFSTLALTIYVCGTFRARYDTTPADAPPQPLVPGCYFPQHWPTAAALYAAMGMAVLAKGPVGFVLPTAVIGMFLLIVRLPRRPVEDAGSRTAGDWLLRVLAPFEPLHFLTTCWTMRPLTAVFAVLAVALPWYCAVGLATEGEFLRGFFLEHNLGRATGVMESHRGSVLFYPAAILVGFFPWSVFALPLAIDTALQLRRDWSPMAPRGAAESNRWHAGYVLAVCWIGVYVVLFTLARTKLPSYVTPCYPALALLVGGYFDRWSRQSPAVAGRWLWAAFACLAIVGLAIGLGVPLAARRFLPGEEWLGLIGLTPLAGGVACLGLAAARNFRAAAGVFGAAAVTFAVLVFAVGADRASRHQQAPQLLAALAARSPEAELASYGLLEPSWVFYSGRPVRELKRITPEGNEAVAFLSTSPHAYLITTDKRLAQIGPLLPPGTTVIYAVPYFLHDEQLVAVGWSGVDSGVARGAAERSSGIR